LAVVKSKLLKQISDNYPNFLKKDLENFLNIVLNEIKLALHKGDNVELRNFGTWSTHIQKARLSRNPKTGEIYHTSSAYLTFVSLNENGKPQRVDDIEPENDIENRRFKEGNIRHEERKERLRKDRK